MRHIRAALGALCLALASSFALAQDGAFSTMGALAPILDRDKGTGGPWSLQGGDGTFTLENASDANAIRYYHVKPSRQPVTFGVDATVDASETGVVGGGLLYGFKGEGSSLSYYAFVANGAQRTVYRRDSDGFRKVLAVSEQEAAKGATARLDIVEGPRGSEFRSNGVVLFEIKSGRFENGSIGIIAFGRGRFSFRNFAENRP